MPDWRCHLASTFIVVLRQSFESRRKRCLRNDTNILGRYVVSSFDHYTDEIRYSILVRLPTVENGIPEMQVAHCSHEVRNRLYLYPDFMFTEM